MAAGEMRGGGGQLSLPYNSTPLVPRQPPPPSAVLTSSMKSSGMEALADMAGSQRGGSVGGETPSPSATSSVGGGGSGKKKGGKGGGAGGKSIEEELCLICGDKASGYHYNALSCEGCKGFFRRSITRNLTYVCKDGSQCEMDMWMRRRCQACRLRRCKEVGMKEECLLSTEQCKAREGRRKPAKERKKSTQVSRKVDTPAPGSAPLRSNSTFSENRAAAVAEALIFNSEPLSGLPTRISNRITQLVALQERFEMPDGKDIDKVLSLSVLFNPDKPGQAKELLFTQLAHFTILATQLIVEYAKHVPGFQDLPIEDEITLLRGTTCENLMLRTARQYDMTTKTVIMADGKSYTQNSLAFAGLGEIVEPMYAFCETCGHMKMDNAEYSMLMAISLFSERPNLLKPHLVEKIQEEYVSTLQKYCEAKFWLFDSPQPKRSGGAGVGGDTRGSSGNNTSSRLTIDSGFSSGSSSAPTNGCGGTTSDVPAMSPALEKRRRRLAGARFAKLLCMFTALRTLNRVHSDMCLNLKVKTDNMPDLLLDYFSVH